MSYTARLQALTGPQGDFTENWFGTDSCVALARLTDLACRLDGDLIEIGAWEGRSTVAMANAAWRHGRSIETIDTWEGSPGEISAELAADRDVYGTWQTNVRTLTAGNVQPHRQSWRDFFIGHAGRIALCFIDAEHTYQEVRDNIAAVLPHMVEGGIICGDDAHHEPVVQAVTELLGPQVYVDATLWIWQKPHTSNLEAMYAQRCVTPSDIYLHLPRFASLVEAMNAQHVIELGSRTGVSTVAWLYGLEKTGGKLTTVDLDPRPDIGEWPHWRHIQVDDTDPTVRDSIGGNADILFIDTSHHYDHTLWELRNWWRKVKPGGLILLHDTELPVPEGAPEGDPLFPVRSAIEVFTAEQGWKWTNIPECWGLGIIKAGDA